MKIGGWQHVAAVVDRSSGDATYFVNGDAVASASFVSEVPLVFGPCTIGAWKASKPDSWSRRFHGRMNEFAIFNRALSNDEIIELFQDGSGFGSDP